MTDHAQEQADELEVLASIFMDDLEEVSDDIPSGWPSSSKVWRVAVAPQQEEGQETEWPVRVEVVFAHTPSYPDEPPLVRARALEGLSAADVAALQSQLDAAAEENLGMAMIYTLISLAQEWVQEKAANMAVPTSDPAAEEKRRREAEEARLAALRAHGHPVTPEAFAEWRARFDAEQALERARLEGGERGGEEKKARLTGKQWFLQQEAQHIEVEEPDLEEGEEDGEDERANWGWGEEGGEGGSDDEDFLDEEEDEEELLDELLAATGKGG